MTKTPGWTEKMLSVNGEDVTGWYYVVTRI